MARAPIFGRKKIPPVLQRKKTSAGTSYLQRKAREVHCAFPVSGKPAARWYEKSSDFRLRENAAASATLKEVLERPTLKAESRRASGVSLRVSGGKPAARRNDTTSDFRLRENAATSVAVETCFGTLMPRS
jgi:hypothetical protein